MLTASVIVVLREALEASFLLGVLLGLTHHIHHHKHWLFPGLLLGLVMAVAYAFNLETISNWFNGVGQEVINGLILVFLFVFLLAIRTLIVLQYHRIFSLNLIFAASTALIISHEGAELLVYWSGIFHVDSYRVSVLAGSVIGVGLGVSTIAICYFVLVSVGREVRCRLFLLMLAIMGAGFTLQALRNLIQADWIPSGAIAWNTSWLVSEDSIAGQILYALIGYEASPSVVQVIVYAAALILMFILPRFLFGIYTQSKAV